jgi:hypothetical protein
VLLQDSLQEATEVVSLASLQDSLQESLLSVQDVMQRCQSGQHCK